MVPKHCADLPDIQVTDEMDKSTLINQLEGRQSPGQQLIDVIKYMRKVRYTHVRWSKLLPCPQIKDKERFIKIFTLFLLNYLLI